MPRAMLIYFPPCGQRSCVPTFFIGQYRLPHLLTTITLIPPPPPPYHHHPNTASPTSLPPPPSFVTPPHLNSPTTPILLSFSVVRWQLAKARGGNHQAKTRGEVSGKQISKFKPQSTSNPDPHDLQDQIELSRFLYSPCAAGTGKKLRAQKGTGKARAGSARAPR
jgi:hypothetical protein